MIKLCRSENAMDKYMIERIEDLIKSVRVAAGKDPSKKMQVQSQTVSSEGIFANLEAALQNAITLVSAKMPIQGDVVPLVRSEVLDDLTLYPSRATVVIGSHRKGYEQVAAMAHHYNNMSIQAQFNGYIFNPKYVNNWLFCGLKPGDSVELFAYDLNGNADRSENAVHDNLARSLGCEKPHDDDLTHYICRKMNIHNKYGLHARPSAIVVKAASRYDGNVYLRNPYTGNVASAKSILGVMTLNQKRELKGEGAYVEVLFEPSNDTHTSEIFRAMKEGVKEE